MKRPADVREMNGLEYRPQQSNLARTAGQAADDFPVQTTSGDVSEMNANFAHAAE